MPNWPDPVWGQCALRRRYTQSASAQGTSGPGSRDRPGSSIQAQGSLGGSEIISIATAEHNWVRAAAASPIVYADRTLADDLNTVALND